MHRRSELCTEPRIIMKNSLKIMKNSRRTDISFVSLWTTCKCQNVWWLSGGAGARVPLTSGFEDPKLNILGPYLIFVFFLPCFTQHIIYFIFYYFSNTNKKNSNIASLSISFLNYYKLKVEILVSWFYIHIRVIGVHLGVCHKIF